LSFASGTLLVDTPPELRLQLLSADVDRVDAVWLTHTHADHLHGIDDLRIFSLRNRGSVPIFGAPDALEEVRLRFRYIFDSAIQPPEGTSKPDLELLPFDPSEPIEILEQTFTPLRLPHGPMTVYGFRVGDLGYVTDAKSLEAGVMDALDGVRVLVLNALWWGNPHPTHLNVEEAIEVARSVGAERTYLTHLTHRLRYVELAADLPEGIEPAYDGLTVDIS